MTSGKKLTYKKDLPFEKEIRYYNYYHSTDSFLIPDYFIIPQAWEEVVIKLELNGIKFTRITADSSTVASVIYFNDYKTVRTPYEGHYLHYDVEYRIEKQKVSIRKGDYLIPLHQQNKRYILEALVPDAVDSYFCWGYFDSMLQQKEGFSDYVFEDIATDFLKNDSKLKKDFREWQEKNKSASEYEQLNYIYQRSKYFEKNFLRYPVLFSQY